MSATFAKPQYSKIKNAAGNPEPCYTFAVLTSMPLSGSIDRKETPTDEALLIQLMKDDVSSNWLQSFLGAFLQSAQQYFTKKYTIDVLIKYLNHKLSSAADSSVEARGATVDSEQAVFNPSEVIIFQGRFTLVWNVKYENMMIPGFGEDEVSKDATELFAVDDIDADLNDDGELPSSSRHYEKRKVKEARLRAILTQYKAERSMARYLEKYGEEYTDSEWSGSESDSD